MRIPVLFWKAHLGHSLEDSGSTRYLCSFGNPGRRELSVFLKKKKGFPLIESTVWTIFKVSSLVAALSPVDDYHCFSFFLPTPPWSKLLSPAFPFNHLSNRKWIGRRLIWFRGEKKNLFLTHGKTNRFIFGEQWTRYTLEQKFQISHWLYFSIWLTLSTVCSQKQEKRECYALKCDTV